MNIEPPSDQEHRYLDAFRDASAMPEAARDRVWARLAGGPVGPVGGAAANDAGPLLEAVGGGGRGWLARPGLLVGASVALVTGALVLALLDADAPAEQPSTTTVAVAEQQPQRHEVPSTEQAKLEPEIAPVELELEVKAVEPAPVAKRTAPRARVRTKPMPEAPTSSLADERRLIEQTHAALGRGEAASALSLLRKHEREFEAGVFVEEREALLAIATCTAGLLDDGRAAAQAFLASYPHAVLAARVRKSCALGD
jgi:hypothetical protein